MLLAYASPGKLKRGSAEQMIWDAHSNINRVYKSTGHTESRIVEKEAGGLR